MAAGILQKLGHVHGEVILPLMAGQPLVVRFVGSISVTSCLEQFLLEMQPLATPARLEAYCLVLAAPLPAQALPVFLAITAIAGCLQVHNVR